MQPTQFKQSKKTLRSKIALSPTITLRTIIANLEVQEQANGNISLTTERFIYYNIKNLDLKMCTLANSIA